MAKAYPSWKRGGVMRECYTRDKHFCDAMLIWTYHFYVRAYPQKSCRSISQFLPFSDEPPLFKSDSMT